MSAASNNDMQQEVPIERWDLEATYHPSTRHARQSIYARFGSFCEGKVDSVALKRSLLSCYARVCSMKAIFPWCHTGIDLFDRELFALSLNEAIAIDPQQRLLLEETKIAWDDAKPAVGQLNSNNVGEDGSRFQCLL